MTLSATPRNLIGLSLLLLAVAGIFGILSTSKVKTLRSNVADATAARDSAEHRRADRDKEIKGREAAIAAEKAKIAETESRVASAETELVKLQTEKADLQTKLGANESEIANLQKQLEETKPGSANPGAASSVELQAQLDDARRQLEDAEREKTFLSDKLQSLQTRSSQLEEERRRRVTAGKVGVRGTVLAVNQAYNFVVLNLGGRQGVEPNSEMLVLRDGSFIGKIRISSVEPATAIGDIITSTLARGVQVQPGDIVIYAGSSS
jgi:predicted RNase H-like nuclease (RuvC/YqgF family)